MKKFIIFAIMFMALSHYSFAEQRDVFLEFHKKNNSGNNGINRAPIRLPIQVSYDSDTNVVEVSGNETLEGEVFLYTINGTLDAYSSTLNTTFSIQNPNTYVIIIQGNGWYAEGEIDV